MDIMEMTREDFDKVPYRAQLVNPPDTFYSLVIIPMDETHDSGWRCMDFVAVNEHREPLFRLSGGSDVVHINGIGGWGSKNGDTFPKWVEPISWSIDCLPKSGYMRLFSDKRLSCNDYVVSSFEVFAEDVKYVFRGRVS